MKHAKCGGIMIRIQKLNYKSVYQCNRCGKILTVYRQIATNGNLTKEK